MRVLRAERPACALGLRPALRVARGIQTLRTSSCVLEFPSCADNASNRFALRGGGGGVLLGMPIPGASVSLRSGSGDRVPRAPQLACAQAELWGAVTVTRRWGKCGSDEASPTLKCNLTYEKRCVLWTERRWDQASWASSGLLHTRVPFVPLGTLSSLPRY